MTIPPWQLLVVLGGTPIDIDLAFTSTIRARAAYGRLVATGVAIEFAILGSPRVQGLLVVAKLSRQPYSGDYLHLAVESATALFCSREGTGWDEEVLAGYAELVQTSAKEAFRVELSRKHDRGALSQILRQRIDDMLPRPWCAVTRQPSEFPYWTGIPLVSVPEAASEGCWGYGVDQGPISTAIPFQAPRRRFSWCDKALDRRRERRVWRS